MTKDQLISFLGTIFKWAGSALVTRGFIVSPDVAAIFTGPNAIDFYAGVVMAIVPLIRDRYIHSDIGKISATGALAAGPDPVIEPIEVTGAAPPELQKIAMDPTVPTVVVARPPLGGRVS